MQVSLYDCGGKGGRQALLAAALVAVILVQEVDRHKWVSYAAAECARGEAEQQGEGEQHGELEQEGPALAQQLQQIFGGDVKNAYYVWRSWPVIRSGSSNHTPAFSMVQGGCTLR